MHARIPADSARRAALAVIALVALVGMGCSKKLLTQLIPNQAPEITLTAAPVLADPDNSYFYAYSMQWVGHDPDGRVDYFLYAVDPKDPNVYDPQDTAWRVTVKNESTFFFASDSLYDPVNPRDPKAEAFHVISIFAVDNQGLRSKLPATRAFFSFTQCPVVRITDPSPNAAFTPLVTPTVTFKWTGFDPDGEDTKPKRWVFQRFSQINPDFPGISDFLTFALNNPDSVRRLYAPDFPGWRSVGQDTTSFQIPNHNPGLTYLFVVTGFDEAGAYDPVFTPGRNMLKYEVTYAGTFGPVITMFNQYFFFTYDIGGYDARPERWFQLEVPAEQPVTFNWLAAAPAGAEIRRYRWGLDLPDLSDETPRRDEARDLCRWSAWSRNTTSATLGPFVDGQGQFRELCPGGPTQRHQFFIEAEDNNGLKSLGIIDFTPVVSTFENELLFVDDTRLKPDQLSTASSIVDPPAGPWPSAAELDTFLFAKGGFPWKSYPEGTLSTPGIFNGYRYDTVGTRGISIEGVVPLSTLGKYRHVVWYTDEAGASYTSSPTDRSTPITALRLVNSPGRPVILSTYMDQGFKTNGGHVWLSGGGAAYATLIQWNRLGTSPNEYTARDNELIPGRLMYSFSHWREGVAMRPSALALKYDQNSPGFGANRPGRGWPTVPVSPTPPAPPDYSGLPTFLFFKTPDSDPAPPYRTSADQYSFFYRGDYSAEYMSRPTFVREYYLEADSLTEKEYSTLDTLYLTFGGTSDQYAPVMTYYHGKDTQPMIFSGFNFWYWRRSDCIALVDWVLQSVWGLSRDASAPRHAMAPVAARRARR